MLGFLPVYSTVQDQILSFCSWRGPSWDWRWQPMAGHRATGSLPAAPVQLSGAADASLAPQPLLGSWVQLSFRQRHLWACSSSHQPQYHLHHSRLPLVELVVIHPWPAAAGMAFCLGTLVGVCGFCMPAVISTRLLGPSAPLSPPWWDSWSSRATMASLTTSL